MLQAAPHTQTLQINALPWLIANTIKIHGNPCLVVHRSNKLSDDDALYRPVVEFLASHPHTVQCGPDERFDFNFKGGMGTVTTYRLAVP
ncbi:hypothetical protein PROPHIBWHA1_38 [Mycobacterium phage prophiBWHA-1]|nr:hypothetical protein PROPHIBWHA1_38 [Mycobacterium phage prophiBWHA-1]